MQKKFKKIEYFYNYKIVWLSLLLFFLFFLLIDIYTLSMYPISTLSISLSMPYFKVKGYLAICFIVNICIGPGTNFY